METWGKNDKRDPKPHPGSSLCPFPCHHSFRSRPLTCPHGLYAIPIPWPHNLWSCGTADKQEREAPTGTLGAWGLPHVLSSSDGLAWDSKSLPRMLVSDKKSLKFKTHVQNVTPTVSWSLLEEYSFDFSTSPEGWHHSTGQSPVRMEPKAPGCQFWHLASTFNP